MDEICSECCVYERMFYVMLIDAYKNSLLKKPAIIDSQVLAFFLCLLLHYDDIRIHCSLLFFLFFSFIISAFIVYL